MYVISSIGNKLFEKLRGRAYRHAYMAEHLRRGIAYQIRALRDQRGWNQGAFSKALEKPQSVVCRLEDPSYGKVTVQTLLEVAKLFDVALQVSFVPYTTFLQATRDTTVKSMTVASFEDEFNESNQVSGAVSISNILSALMSPQEQPIVARSARNDDPMAASVPRFGSLAEPGIGEGFLYALQDTHTPLAA